MRSSACHHANSLASQVLSEVKSLQDNVLHVIDTHTSQIDTELYDAPPPPQAQADNTTTSDAVPLEMLRVIKDLQQEMKEIKKSGQDAGNSTQKNGDKKKRVRKSTTKYPWSHGSCAHDSVDYSWKKVVHQDDSTVVEKKGGSTKWCN